MLRDAPSLVVRRIDGGGWAPMPDTAAQKIRDIIGVTRVQRRTFGAVTGPGGPLTVHGRPDEPSSTRHGTLKDDEALVGPGVPLDTGEELTLKGAVTRRLRVAGRWPDHTAMATQDIAVTTVSTAKALLGLSKDYDSDLAVWVHRDEEANAVVPDIQEALDFAVHVTTREEAVGREAAFLAKRAGLSLFFFLPALIGLVLIIAASVRERLSFKGEVGLLKALGWTTSDVLTFHLMRAAVVGAPGAVLGVAAAFASVALPGVTWPLEIFFEWDTAPPPLVLSFHGAAVALATIGGGVIAPWLAAAALPAFTGSAVDPAELIKGG
jgi:ABC-type lipoprotein release transport system permease subunit